MAFAEFHSRLDSFQIMAVLVNGKLRKLRCPFLVLCIKGIEGLKDNKFYYVGMVGTTQDNKLCYYIEDYPFHYSHFKIYVV